jgi:hypothetical protein
MLRLQFPGYSLVQANSAQVSAVGSAPDGRSRPLLAPRRTTAGTCAPCGMAGAPASDFPGLAFAIRPELEADRVGRAGGDHTP